jgi:SAM-dependent methyltransferase
VLDGKSLETWNTYFPKAQVYGLDIDPACLRFENTRTKVFIGSQADADLLADVRAQVPEGFDVIIDDGSHYVKHVIATFSGLFSHLKPGGIYVVEDLHVSGWRDWGRVALNRGMALKQETEGNDPEEMARFLSDVRKRSDVAELVVHLKKICFIRKAGAEPSPPLERGDRLEDLFPAAPRQRILLQKIARRLVGDY